jgi:hypothetical protein
MVRVFWQVGERKGWRMFRDTDACEKWIAIWQHDLTIERIA